MKYEFLSNMALNASYWKLAFIILILSIRYWPKAVSRWRFKQSQGVTVSCRPKVESEYLLK